MKNVLFLNKWTFYRLAKDNYIEPESRVEIEKADAGDNPEGGNTSHIPDTYRLNGHATTYSGTTREWI